jgi:hypothetical protein
MARRLGTPGRAARKALTGGPSPSARSHATSPCGPVVDINRDAAEDPGWFRSRPFPRPSAVLREHHGEEAWRGLAREASERSAGRARYLRDALERFSVTWSGLVGRWLFRLVYGLLLLAAIIAGALFGLAALMADDVRSAGHPEPVIAAIAAGLIGVGIWAMFGSSDDR